MPPTTPSCIRWARWALLGFFLLPGWSVAQTADVEVVLRTPTPFTVAQGHPVTVVASITNRGARPVLLVDELGLPAGWHAMVEEGAYEVPRDGQVTRLLTIVVPAGAATRTYSIDYRVKHSGAVVVEERLALLLQATPRIHFEKQRSATYTVSGETYRAPFKITNRGNVPVTVRLEAESNTDTDPEAEEVRLQPGEAKVWAPEVTTPQLLTASREVVVRAEAEVVDPVPDGETVLAKPHELKGRARSATVVLPRIERAALRYHEFPLVVGTSAGMVADASPLQLGRGTVQPGFRVFGQGRGPLREGSTTVVGVEAASPFFVSGAQRAQAYDFYQLSVTAPHYAAILGDGPFDLSPLTTVYGTGGSGTALLRRVRVGAFYLTNRFSAAREDEYGGRVGYVVAPEWLEVGGNVLRRDGRDAGTFASVSATWNAADRVRAEAEVGVSEDDAGERGGSGAIRLRGSGDWGRLGLHVLARDHTLPGYRADQLQAGLGGQTRLGPRWRLGINANFLSQRSDTGAFAVAYLNRSYRLSVLYGSAAIAELNRSERVSERGEFFRERTETYGRITARFGVGGVRVALRGLAGYADQMLLEGVEGRRRMTYGLGANASYGPSPYVSLSASADYVRGRAQFDVGAAAPESFSVATQASLRLAARTELQASVTLAQTRTVFTSDVQVYRLGLQHQLPWAHRLTLTTEYSRSSASEFAGGFEAFSAFATYAVPLTIKLHRSRSSGLVRGRLTEGQTGERLGGVPVFLGQEGRLVGGVLTSDAGEFYLADVPVGEYDLRADVAQLDGAYVLRHGAEVPVHVRGGEVEEIDLEAVSASVVRIRIVAQPLTPSAECIVRGAQPVGPMAGVAVEVEGPQIVRGFTDVSGELRLGDLQPGTYTIRPLPSYYAGMEAVEADSLVVAVEGGETREVTFSVQPVCRRVTYASPTPLSLSTSTARSRIEGGPSVGSAAPADSSVHIVKPGEWLSQIARRYYGPRYRNHWQRIHQANRAILSDPDLIFPGQQLRIPPLEE